MWTLTNAKTCLPKMRFSPILPTFTHCTAKGKYVALKMDTRVDPNNLITSIAFYMTKFLLYKLQPFIFEKPVLGILGVNFSPQIWHRHLAEHSIWHLSAFLFASNYETLRSRISWALTVFPTQNSVTCHKKQFSKNPWILPELCWSQMGTG